MASCTGGSSYSPGPLEPGAIDRLAHEVYKCVKKDQLVKAKFVLKGLKKDAKKKIVSKTFDGNAPLFIAAQQGQVHFVNYLLDECSSDIEQRGVYEVQEDRSKHQVTPLWCAAVANKLEIVKTLIKHGAAVNATSDTQSTPVRSACYMTNVEVVKYLAENGADIHKPNVNGGTCLINSVQSVELCKFLIERGANVNAQDNSGNLALHYAIREGRMETVKLLLKHNSDPYVVNDFGDDSIQTAALRGYADILDYLEYKIKPSVDRQIQAHELMAANFVDEKHDIQRAVHTWRYAMGLRYQDPDNVVKKAELPEPKAAYQFAKEATNMEDIDEIAANPDAVYMQALLIRERTLGPDHKDTIFGLMYRGAVYADTHRYQRCVDLWKYAFILRHQKQEPLNHECLFTLQALCKLFWEIHEEHSGGFTNEAVQYTDVMEVFEMSIKEIKAAKLALSIKPTPPSNINQKEEYQTMLQLSLHLIHLLYKLSKSDDQSFHFKKTVHDLVRLGVKGQTGRGLLHMAVEKNTSIVMEEYYSPFPSVEVVETLIECGASNVNCMDDEGNLPLHICGELIVILGNSNQGNHGNSKDITEYSKIASIVNLFLQNGAHIDCRNKAGKMAIDDLDMSIVPRLMDHVTLKCLAARVVKAHHIHYKGEVPQSLVPFIELH